MLPGVIMNFRLGPRLYMKFIQFVIFFSAEALQSESNYLTV